MPPPIVTTGENWRMMKRSPGKSSAGSASLSCANASSPGLSRLARIQPDFRDRLLRVGVKVDAGAVFERLGGVEQRELRIDSSRWSEMCPAMASVMPRARSSVETPARFSAVRCPAMAASAGEPCTCTPRTRTRLPAGKTSISSSLRIVPATRVPVTTVPKPFMVKTRSIGRRASAAESFAVTSRGEMGER